MSISEVRLAALKFLARREYSCSELILKLQRKAFSLKEIKAELNLLQEENFQSDTRFCEAVIRERIRIGYGPRAIRALLIDRGIGETLIDQGMSVYSKTFWQEHLEALWQKRFRAESPNDSKPSLSEKARQYRFLSYRGFDSEAIYTLLKQVNHE